MLHLFAAYYPAPVPAEELLDLVGLRSVATTPWRHLSGGEQQRLSLALALVGRPEVAFLDEPTAGVDPEGRIAVRAVVAGLKEKGVCVVLTTHELGEAEKMADRIVILSAGRVVLEGTPHGLTAGAGPARPAAPPGCVTFGAPPSLDVVALAAAIGPGTTAAETSPGRYRVEATAVETPAVTAAVANFLAARGATLTDLVVGKTLEDVYFEAVGAAAADHAPADAPRSATSRRRRGRAGAGGGPVSTTADALRPLTAQTGAEVHMTLRRGETLLLTLGIPVVFLLFFSKVSVVSTPTATPADFFVPGILALAVMSTAMVSLGIATGFERGYGVLKRLGATPLGRPRLLGAKIITIVAVELLQAAVLLPVGLALGWNPGGGGAVGGGRGHRRHPPRLGRLRRHRPPHGRHAAGRGEPGRGQRPLPHPPAAGRHDRPALQAARAAWPASPSCCRPAALSSALHATLGSGGSVPAESWVVLAVWAVAAPVAAALTFRWE